MSADRLCMIFAQKGALLYFEDGRLERDHTRQSSVQEKQPEQKERQPAGSIKPSAQLHG